MTNDGTEWRDLISRRQVIETLEGMVAGAGVSYPDDVIDLDDALRRVKALKAFRRKEGFWLFHKMLNAHTGQPYREYWCSKCGFTLHKNRPTSKYCPNCGAAMKQTHLEAD